MKTIERVFFTEEVKDYIREEIRRNHENEVFFLGSPTADGEINAMEAVAYGNANAVNAVKTLAGFGDIAVHNHPDGVILPSEADLQLAQQFSDLGVGSIVIDNNAVTMHVIVKPFVRRETVQSSTAEIADYFGTDSLLALNLEGYEYRAEQRAAAMHVTTAFNEKKIAAIEAGTGIGKSFAYLIPAIFYAAQNRERVVISTNTISLQEQLMHKDLPFLHQYLPLEFKSVLIKGRGNYICLRRFHAYDETLNLIVLTRKAQMDILKAWVKKTADGSKSDLTFIVEDGLWAEICCEADQCARIHCRYYDACFYQNVRREASTADILVVNHHLLFADMAIKMRAGNYKLSVLLPPFSRVIFDEAHNLEDVATSYFGGKFSIFGLKKNINRLARNNGKGLLQTLMHMPGHKDQASEFLTRCGEEKSGVESARDFIYSEFTTLENTAFGANFFPGFDTKFRFTEQNAKTGAAPLILARLETIKKELETLTARLNRFYKWTLEHFAERLEKDPGLENRLISLRSVIQRIGHLAQTFQIFLSLEDKNCYWMEKEQFRKKPYVSFQFAPIRIADLMAVSVYESMDTVVFTSATLAVNRTFDYFNARLGLKAVANDRLIEVVLDSPFDFQKNVFFAVPKDIGQGVDQICRALRGALALTEGGAFALFTSYRMMRDVYAKMRPFFEESALDAYIQGERPNAELLKSFRQDKRASLFGTMSFWEGIDVKGDSLRAVIIDKLPFAVPTEPVHKARSEAIEETGGNAFAEYSLPNAVIKLKQGFGRLIRSKDDYGIILILDTRLIQKFYGKFFLNSLPKIKLYQDPLDSLLTSMNVFLTRHEKRAEIGQGCRVNAF